MVCSGWELVNLLRLPFGSASFHTEKTSNDQNSSLKPHESIHCAHWISVSKVRART